MNISDPLLKNYLHQLSSMIPEPSKKELERFNIPKYLFNTRENKPTPVLIYLFCLINTQLKSISRNVFQGRFIQLVQEMTGLINQINRRLLLDFGFRMYFELAFFRDTAAGERQGKVIIPLEQSPRQERIIKLFYDIINYCPKNTEYALFFIIDKCTAVHEKIAGESNSEIVSANMRQLLKDNKVYKIKQLFNQNQQLKDDVVLDTGNDIEKLEDVFLNHRRTNIIKHNAIVRALGNIVYRHFVVSKKKSLMKSFILILLGIQLVSGELLY